MKRRGAAAAVVLLLWVIAAGLFARRELFRDDTTRLADAGLRVSPGTVNYVVEQAGTQIGYALSTVDTTPDGLIMTDQLITELPVGGRLHRGVGRSTIRLTRALALSSFDLTVRSEAGVVSVAGRPERDTLVLSIRSGDAPPDTQRIALKGQLLLPSVVPLFVALGHEPAVGRQFTVSMFDPMVMGPRDVTLAIRAESLLTVSDSAVFDSTAGRWQAVSPDTVRAWQVAAANDAKLSAWVDAQGRVVRLDHAAGFTLRRAPYEFAAENWRRDSRSAAKPRADADILESTAIAASAPIRAVRRAERLRFRLSGVDLSGFDLAGGRQSVSGDTLTVARERGAALRPAYTLPLDDSVRARFGAELAPEPLLQSEHPSIVALARRIAGDRRDPKAVAERINRWVSDSLRKQITVGIPDALQVLGTRRGDCNEHTQLYVALARAAGVPTRTAAGLAQVGGKYYYHAWPEVYLGDWVAVDPTFGQFPADAAHLRFVNGGLTRQAALLRLMGQLQIDLVKNTE
jgi:transglutaminase-like putative cysteine protease